MICEHCYGKGERGSVEWRGVKICPNCQHFGIVHCCEGEFVDFVLKAKERAVALAATIRNTPQSKKVSERARALMESYICAEKKDPLPEEVK